MILKKIKSRKELEKIVEDEKEKGRKIGFTCGVFDLIHVGHVHYLNEAKKICDLLVVSLNTDESVRQYKGEKRPINCEEDRAVVVASLECVDFVTFHPERRMKTSLELFKPDFYIKGGDYSEGDLTSRSVIENYGGKIVIIPEIAGKSTTSVINKVLDAYGK